MWIARILSFFHVHFLLISSSVGVRQNFRFDQVKVHLSGIFYIALIFSCACSYLRSLCSRSPFSSPHLKSAGLSNSGPCPSARLECCARNHPEPGGNWWNKSSQDSESDTRALARGIGTAGAVSYLTRSLSWATHVCARLECIPPLKAD